ncbi:RCC1 and BTB domain-containing protein 1-like isoform X1 [Schistocerca americana]|uniref:RCC1 and BTB domain-containing protein 1-like n=1 Tax=Schistocerca nitens TaxID=7011 RepID=UPI001F4FD976|nr:RCC1 and BTB domain-containing protein 1-like isoform X1 [Schistocerca americana]XP_047109133.1 RCC1 and BTB domain-containing protein 1-like isoform X1 [Schistocerca piceifrons]XP_049802104.1 RCC1 and BTB domain-containing protein 1-like [Schistocerca nitens]XP_049802106.1 RCC1 and BTB domain-containing protein 1-like [Schistocerca nitens]XP_049949991.1 RCC1 and BTB domain-containing protein 1-like isoform X1 [Schistocerca serialis cubense]
MDLRKWAIFSLLEPRFVSKIKIACVFGNSGNEALIVTEDDNVYALGSNSAGCLGLECHDSTLFPKKVKALCHKRVEGFAYGSGPHVLAYTADGLVFSWGHNGYCEVGDGTSCQRLKPTVIDMALEGKHVVAVAAGSHHSLTLTDDGEIYAWGHNNCGQVGSALSSNQSAPRKVNSVIGGKKCVSIACGQTSSMAVTENGEVYAWGYNGVGQLGIGNTSNQQTPVRVKGILCSVVITKVECGYSHTLALSDMGQLFAWGSNGYGQLGTGTKSNCNSPVQIAQDIGRIVDIAASHYSQISAAMTQNSTVYMWGYCRGQIITLPTKTPFSSLHEVFACFSTPAVMWKPLEVKQHEGNTVAESLRAAFDDPNTSDLTINVQGRPIYVHKTVLKIRCEHFRAMFEHNWQESTRSELNMEYYTYPVYRAFLEYLYTDHVLLPPENALELLVLATEYCEAQLKRLCEQIIEHGITVENAASLYAAAIQYQAKELEEFCFKFCLNHMTAVVQTDDFSKLEGDTLKDFIRRAAHNGAFKS